MKRRLVDVVFGAVGVEVGGFFILFFGVRCDFL